MGAVVCVDAEDNRSIGSIEGTVAVYVKAEDIVYICVIFICYLFSLSLVFRNSILEGRIIVGEFRVVCLQCGVFL